MKSSTLFPGGYRIILLKQNMSDQNKIKNVKVYNGKSFTIPWITAYNKRLRIYLLYIQLREVLDGPSELLKNLYTRF